MVGSIASLSLLVDYLFIFFFTPFQIEIHHVIISDCKSMNGHSIKTFNI